MAANYRGGRWRGKFLCFCDVLRLGARTRRRIKSALINNLLAQITLSYGALAKRLFVAIELPLKRMQKFIIFIFN
jgi:hypothetical protein